MLMVYHSKVYTVWVVIHEQPNLLQRYVSSFPFKGESNEMDQRFKFVGAIALYILHYQLYRIVDKKMFRTLWEVNKKVNQLQYVD